MFDSEKLMIIICVCVGGGGVLFLCLPPYNSNFQYFEIKSLVPRTSDLRIFAVYILASSQDLMQSVKLPCVSSLVFENIYFAVIY